MNHLVSIIIPIYNVEEYIRKCVTSVIEQSYRNLEIILIDDGTPDHSMERIQDLVEGDGRIKVFQKENGGLSDARNYGLKYVTGDYVFFLDSDDYLTIDAIEVLLRLAGRNEADVVIGEFENVVSDDEIIVSLNSEEAVNLDKKSIFRMLYDRNKATVMTTSWGILYQTHLFNQLRFPFGKLHEDEFTTYKVYLEAQQIVYTSRPIYLYRQRVGSITANKTARNYLDLIEALKEREALLQSHKINSDETIARLMILELELLRDYSDQLEHPELIKQDLKNNWSIFASSASMKRKIKIAYLFLQNGMKA